MKQFTSSEFGSAGVKKQEFLRLVLDDKKRKAAIVGGRDAVKAYREKEITKAAE